MDFCPTISRYGDVSQHSYIICMFIYSACQHSFVLEKNNRDKIRNVSENMQNGSKISNVPKKIEVRQQIVVGQKFVKLVKKFEGVNNFLVGQKFRKFSVTKKFTVRQKFLSRSKNSSCRQKIYRVKNSKYSVAPLALAFEKDGKKLSPNFAPLFAIYFLLPCLLLTICFCNRLSEISRAATRSSASLFNRSQVILRQLHGPPPSSR